MLLSLFLNKSWELERFIYIWLAHFYHTRRVLWSYKLKWMTTLFALIILWAICFYWNLTAFDRHWRISLLVDGAFYITLFHPFCNGQAIKWVCTMMLVGYMENSVCRHSCPPRALIIFRVPTFWLLFVELEGMNVAIMEVRLFCHIFASSRRFIDLYNRLFIFANQEEYIYYLF